ncbi:protein btn1 [Arthroderma uncinatum]|uniref:protein btn1 n=1 Tax=Arthroderma uncinatum TaxID=74035 RepID=UPI00144A58FD|nr:protein btn1 [Arthroderma uncinatum]KAF3480494.1 protein btn1 [Arthroderma uncinatum]
MLPLPCAPNSSWSKFRHHLRSIFSGVDPRVFTAFWLFGLINNVLYVIILSAALDLVGPSVPKGVVLLADVVPSFFTKLCAPYFIHVVPYPVRIFIFVALSASGMFLVALSPAYDANATAADSSITAKIFGVMLASLSSGGGELSFLGLTHFYGPFSLAAWGSGTGAAGLVGAGAYALATTSFGFSVKATLLASAFLPAVMVISFFGILPRGPMVQAKDGYQTIEEVEGGEYLREEAIEPSDGARDDTGGLSVGSITGGTDDLKSTPQQDSGLSWELFKANLNRARALFFPFMLPLLLVYIAEYTINQGVAPTLLFPLKESPFKQFRAFYPTYNAIYQVGVFISRSSTPFFRIHDLYFPSFLQIFNLVLLTLHALFNFIQNVYIVFLVVFWEGLLGGLVYVNTFAEITDRVPKEEREFSLGATTVSDSAGICIAGLLGMVFEVWLYHVLGRPSTQFRKIQVFAVVSFWTLYLLRGDKNGPPGVRFLSSRLQGRMTPWQATVMTMLTLYLSRNFAKLFGLESPEPLANLYSRSYFRATWIVTALDAGFWTAMNIRQKWLRDLASIIFSVYYLIAAEQADEKVRKVRATLTVEHLRVSWNKPTTPYLAFFSKLLRPRLCKRQPVAVRIPRPRESSYKDPVEAWLYFDGPMSTLRDQTNIVLDVPGGGFVAMGPRVSDDKLLAWAGKTGVPILSLDYKKAPEYPYPYALNECYDVYHTIVMTRGRCLGLSGKVCPKIVVTGDSAGGSLAAGLTLMILQSGSTDSRKWRGEDSLPAPTGLVLIYPNLDLNIGSWMTDEEMSLIRDKGMRKTNRNILRRKSEDYYKLTPSTPHPSDDDLAEDAATRNDASLENGSKHPADGIAASSTAASAMGSQSEETSIESQMKDLSEKKPQKLQTRLAVSSMISYFNDRILTPEMMRAMIILYIGPYNRPNFSTDFLLSPVLAPEALLARFPKTYFLTGERDPLVDDTVIFAGRLRQAKLHRFRERKELGLEKSGKKFDEKQHVEVTLIPGISHGFLNIVAVFPEGWKHVFRCARWITEIFETVDVNSSNDLRASTASLASRSRAVSNVKSRPVVDGETDKPGNGNTSQRHHQRQLTGESSGDDDGPLEISMLKMTKISPSPPSSQANISQSDASSPVSPCMPDHKPRTPTQQNNDPKRQKRNIRRPNAAKLFLSPLPAKQTERLRNADNTSHSENDLVRVKQMITGLRREASLTSLPSDEDLLNRRMNGLAGGLMGIGEGAKTP